MQTYRESLHRAGNTVIEVISNVVKIVTSAVDTYFSSTLFQQQHSFYEDF
jgi:hypothetical protein